MSTDPYAPPTSRIADRAIETSSEVTWGQATKVWWSFVWRSLLYSFIAGALLGFIIGLVGALLGAPERTISILGTSAGALVSIPISIWVVRTILRKSWSGFRIAVIPSSER